MIRRPPRSTRTDTLFPYTTLCRSVVAPLEHCPRLRPLPARHGWAVRWQPPEHLAPDRDLSQPLRPVRGTEAACGGTGSAPRQPPCAGSPFPGPRLRRGIQTPLRRLAAGTLVLPYTERPAARTVGKECVRTCSYRWSPAH